MSKTLKRVANLAGIDFGSTTLTWPGASAFSSAQTVNHALKVVPSAIITQGSETRTVSPGTNISAVGSETSTSFALTARMGDGSSPAVGLTQKWYWLAVA